MSEFLALPGLYNLIFLYVEPISAAMPSIFCAISPGTAWFYHELIPSGTPAPTTTAGIDPRSLAAVSQLVNCYLLLALMSTVVFRTIRNTLSKDPAAQEAILGAVLAVLAFADVTHMLVSFFTMPEHLRYDFAKWNSVAWGNIPFTMFLFLIRMAWFAGIGRTRYYFGHQPILHKKL